MSAITIDELSTAQRQIYDLLTKGQTPERITNTLNLTLGVVNAQITRIRNKGIALPGDEGYAGPATSKPNPAHIDPQRVYNQPTERPPSTGGSDSDRIAEVLRTGGQAMNADQLAELASKVGGNSGRDIHPMVLMGVTIQFVKLCGGRMTAHQVIEDVYTALRQFSSENGGKVPGDDGGQTEPMAKTDKERLVLQEEQIASLTDTVTKLKARLGS